MPGKVVEQGKQAAQEQNAKVRKPTKNEQRRAKKKAQKLENGVTFTENSDKRSAASPQHSSAELDKEQQAKSTGQTAEDVEAPTVVDVTIDRPTENDPLFDQFASVFAKFSQDQSVKVADEKEPVKAEVYYDDEDNVPDEDEEAESKAKLSRKAKKKAQKLSIAELKTIVSKPEAVEWTDVSATDPKMLVSIKTTRNVVPVPAHWSLKREYLSSKRGIEKQNFRLPAFIAETGISELRQSAQDMQTDGTLKQKQRERVNPTLGKFDIDYQKLFEAFFRRQTKPNLTRFGEIYFEGKEFEADLKHLRPGELSDDLREALNMPLGAPPPWLINMQRFGPPPSYPALKVPGVNAPIPYGARWGLVSGDWGKPPLLDDGTPRWGGTFIAGDTSGAQKSRAPDPPQQRGLWGELQVVEDEEEEEDEDEDEEADGDGNEAEEHGEETDNAQIGKDEDIGGNGLETPFHGTATESGFTHPGTMSVPEGFDIRKQRRGHETEDDAYPRQAGTVLKERSIRNEGFFGGERAYDLSGSDLHVLGRDEDRSRKRKAGDLDVSVDVDALERDDGLSKDQVKQRYDETHTRERSGQWRGKVDQDDLSQMIAEENAKRLKRNQGRR